MAFLQSISCEYLYLVGDVIDLWSLKRKWYWPTSHSDVIRRLLKRDVKGTALFGPEHGVRGDAQDMIEVDTSRDARTGLPVHSLYGGTEDTLTPTAAMLDEIDVMVYDVQDSGSRYYTFVWTMVLAMRACAKAGKAFV